MGQAHPLPQCPVKQCFPACSTGLALASCGRQGLCREVPAAFWGCSGLSVPALGVFRAGTDWHSDNWVESAGGGFCGA